jgi:hypothetical protein
LLSRRSCRPNAPFAELVRLAACGFPDTRLLSSTPFQSSSGECRVKSFAMWAINPRLHTVAIGSASRRPFLFAKFPGIGKRPTAQEHLLERIPFKLTQQGDGFWLACATAALLGKFPAIPC